MSVLVSSAGKVAGTSVSKAGPLAGGLLAGSAAAFVFQVFLRQRDVLLALAVLLVLASVAAVRLARRLRRPFPLILLGLWAVAVIPAFTLVPDLGFSEYGRALWSPSRIALELGGGWSSALVAWAHGTDGPLNVVLFLPAGLFSLLPRADPLVRCSAWACCPSPSKSSRHGLAHGPGLPATSARTCSALRRVLPPASSCEGLTPDDTFGEPASLPLVATAKSRPSLLRPAEGR